jgi:hypothetical protein
MDSVTLHRRKVANRVSLEGWRKKTDFADWDSGSPASWETAAEHIKCKERLSLRLREEIQKSLDLDRILGPRQDLSGSPFRGNKSIVDLRPITSVGSGYLGTLV